MKIIYNNILPFPGFSAMMLFGVIFARKKYKPLSDLIIDHEKIHAAQAKDCGGWLPFYIKYLRQWIKYGYKDMPFEREAYLRQDWRYYLDVRIPFSWAKFTKR